MSIFVDVYQIARLVKYRSIECSPLNFFRCKVCDKSVLFEYQKLSNHLFFNHGIGIAKYKDFLQVCVQSHCL